MGGNTGSLALLPAPPLLTCWRSSGHPAPAGGPGGGGHFTHQVFEAGRRGPELVLLEAACQHQDRLLPAPSREERSAEMTDITRSNRRVTYPCLSW